MTYLKKNDVTSCSAESTQVQSLMAVHYSNTFSFCTTIHIVRLSITNLKGKVFF